MNLDAPARDTDRRLCSNAGISTARGNSSVYLEISRCVVCRFLGFRARLLLL